MRTYRSHALSFAFLLAVALAATACAGGSAPPTTAADVDAMCRSYARGNNPDVQPPKLVSSEQPPPPASGNGYACVRVTINDSGHVVDPVVVKTDNQDFAQAFVRTLGDWRYEPATRGTAKVPYHTVLTARFPPA